MKMIGGDEINAAQTHQDMTTVLIRQHSACSRSASGSSSSGRFAGIHNDLAIIIENELLGRMVELGRREVSLVCKHPSIPVVPRLT